MPDKLPVNIKEMREKNVDIEACADCKSMCCYDLVMEIDAPRSEKDLATLKWYLHFKHSFIFIYKNIWYHLVRSECRYLDTNTYLCTNYKDRSSKCRDHMPPKCERYEKWYDILFDDQRKLENYVYGKKLIKTKKKN